MKISRETYDENNGKTFRVYFDKHDGNAFVYHNHKTGDVIAVFRIIKRK